MRTSQGNKRRVDSPLIHHNAPRSFLDLRVRKNKEGRSRGCGSKTVGNRVVLLSLRDLGDDLLLLEDATSPRKSPVEIGNDEEAMLLHQIEKSLQRLNSSRLVATMEDPE